MPRAATLPAHTHAARERTRAQPRTSSIEERTAVLETRWEQTVPTLATSKDISDLRSELIKWGLGALITLAAVLVAMITANTARIDRLDAKIDPRFDAMMTEIRALGRAAQ